jgi:hypothetical protein
MNCGHLNLLDTEGPVQTSIRIASPVTRKTLASFLHIQLESKITTGITTQRLKKDQKLVQN